MKNKKNIVYAIIAVVIFIVLFALVNAGVLSRKYEGLLVPIGVNVILAVSLNLIVGFLGELSLGHAGFMSVGAYAGCLFTVHSNLPVMVELPIAFVIGGLAAAIFGLIIGIPALRLKGDYLAIVTLGFGEIIRSVFNSLDILGGSGGLKGIDKSSNYIMAYVLAVITVLVIANLINSKHGRAIKSIRDNVIAAESVGVNVVYYKILAFVLSAFFAGIAGVLYGHNLAILKPATFDFNKSIEILVMVVLGGMGSIPGSIIAAVILTVLPEAMRSLADYRMLFYAVALIVMMLFSSNPALVEFRQRLFGKKKRGGK
ncbi:MAG: branched-chain amino acid ABC transporter permease [Clostridia bacterium]|nr:branched-chain amino acid ABC transporter permease [Clostridia bacterium]